MIARLESFIARFLPKGSALKCVSLVAGGTTIAQGIGIITMPSLVLAFLSHLFLDTCLAKDGLRQDRMRVF